jgi:hypothetical protein
MEPSFVERDSTAPHAGCRGASAPGARDACPCEDRSSSANCEYEERGTLLDVGGKNLFEQSSSEASGRIEVMEDSPNERGDAAALASSMKRLLAIAGAWMHSVARIRAAM